MEKPISVLIVGSGAAENAELARRITGYMELRVAGIVEDGEAALSLLREHKPEAVVLILGKHSDDSIGLLRRMRKLELPSSPYIFIIADAPTPIIYELIWEYGANFVVDKKRHGYSAQFVADFLAVIQDQLSRGDAMNILTVESSSQRRKRLVTRIRTELSRVGVSPKWTGYRYLTIGIRIMVETMTTALYAAIAAEVGKTPTSVERAMRNAIVLTWNRGDKEALSNYTAKLPRGKTVPTVREFISFYANKLRLEYE